MANDLQDDGNICITLSRKNKMFFHFDKTFYMLLGTRQRLNNSQEMNNNIDNCQIKQTSEHNFLGIYIDDEHTWTYQNDHQCSTISS